MTNTALNRTTIVQLTNKSGSNLPQGTIVVVDTDNDKSFETITTSGYTATNVGVILEPNGINNNEIGGVGLAGWVPKVLVSGDHNAGAYLRTSPTVGYAIPFASAGAGDFGIALQNDANPEGFLFGNTTQSIGSGNTPTVGSTPLITSSSNTVLGYNTTPSTYVNFLTVTIPANTLSDESFLRVETNCRFNQSSGGGVFMGVYARIDGGTKFAIAEGTVNSANFLKCHSDTIIFDLGGSAGDLSYTSSVLRAGTSTTPQILGDRGVTIKSGANYTQPIDLEFFIWADAIDASLVFQINTIVIEGPFLNV